MAYDKNKGLIKLGSPLSGWSFPIDKIKLDSYSVQYNTQDIDSYRNANGVLTRTVVSTKIPKVKFSTKNMMTNVEVEEVMSKIRSKYIKETEKKVRAEIYVPEINDYVIQNVYFTDPNFKIYRITEDGTIYFESTELTFIGYGES